MKAILVFALALSVHYLAEAQIIKTSLQLTVRDELGKIVEEASVAIYETEANYTAEKNPVAAAFTDEKGIVKFKDLEAISYYVIVRKGDKDNVGGAERTGKLEAKKLNKETIIIQ